jgi:hypothetical protein
LLAKKISLIYKLSFSTIFFFFNFNCSSFIYLGFKDKSYRSFIHLIGIHICHPIIHNSPIMVYQVTSD